MEPEVVKIERRGRKRKRKDGDGADKTGKKTVVETRAKVLVGRYVKKEFEESGEFLGKIVSYDSGLYRVDYEDGDCEDLETREVKLLIVKDNEMDSAFNRRKKALDEHILKKYAKLEAAAAKKVETVRNDGGGVCNGVELANAVKVENPVRGGAFEVSGAQAEIDGGELSSDFSEDEQPDVAVEVQPPLPPPPELPPSSRNFGVSEEHVSYLLSVYSFLRSYSVCLFLSPFRLDEFVGALNSPVPTTLLDAVHVALIRALKSHVEILSSEGSELASKCLRIMDWSLLDSLTWPVFIVQYLSTMRYAEGPEWKEFYINVLEKSYYSLSAGRRLIVLQLLCDAALDSAELRAEIDTREETEFGPDPDALLAFGDESVSRKVHPHTSESHNTRTPSNTNSFAGVAVDEDGNVDECRLCGMDGILLCCDGCPSAYHSRCIGVAKSFIPEGAWYCPECTINRNGPNVTRVTSLRGAEFFGVDPYEQVFLGSCDHLLVMKTSKGEELNVRYYSPVDIHKVLHALTFSIEHRSLYMEICKGIMQYWEIHENSFSLADTIGIEEPIKTEDVDLSTSSTLLAKESGNALEVNNSGNVNGVTESNTKDTVVDSKSQISLAVEGGVPLSQCVKSEGVNTEAASENGSFNNKNASNVITIPQSKEAKLLPGGRCEGIVATGCVYMGSSFKPQAYLNVYMHGDFAASAAASLAVLSSEEKLVSQAQAASSHRKMMSANYALQTKAFSLAAKRFYWPNYEKKLVEVPRERCGWCFSCKSSISSKRGCLLNGAASNAIKGAAKILMMIRQSKNVEASLASIATYILFMEESLCGLTVGSFVNARYRDQWRKKLEEAATLGEIKASLLEFERNIRDIAFSADWIKLVDDMGFENQVTQITNKSVVAPPQKRGPGRRGRKPSIVVEVPVADAVGKDASASFAWWRGGMLSKHVIQKGILPQPMIKHAARHGGCGKINGVQYVDGLLVPKRSRQFFWRAAVEMCKTASQLALQVRYLDLHVRWSEITCPEQPLSDGKGADAEASVFRNACIIDKKVMGNKICYGVVFENQKHLPSRVLKNILEVEGTEDGTEKNWFVEMRIPLYLIKDFEKALGKRISQPADDNKKLFATSSTLHKKRLKSSGKNIFSFLSQKRDNQGKCLCSICQLDVPFRIAASCVTCQGYFHKQCGVGSNVQAEFLFTCKRCYIEKEATTQKELVGDSPTSPLLLQGQESQLPTTAIKGGDKLKYDKAVELLRQSSEKKTPATNNLKTSKIGKQNGSEKKPPMANGSKKSSKKSTNTNSKAKKASTKLSLGLIWKKKPEDSGLEFRTRNLLLKDNPHGHLLAPQCHLCMQPYDKTLMYIRCEKCVKWFHADSVDLKESDMLDLIGFKCCRCRRIRIPICPYTDPETRRRLESKKKPQPRIKKESDNLGSDSNSETNDDQMSDWDLDATTPLFESEEGLINVYEDDSLHSFPKVEQVNDHNLEVDFEPGPVSGPGPKKLPVRRHMKESDGGNSSINNNNNNPAFDFPTNGDVSNMGAESSTPIVQWDVSTNGFEDNMMFDYGDLNYEDMEFEPQTYFSFNELLASDDTVQPPPPPENTVVDPSAAAVVEDCNPEQFQIGSMGITYENQEPMFSVESSLDMMPCVKCLQTEPCPELYCDSCNLIIHQDCSPWDESSSWDLETGWKCGNCRDWQ